MQALLGIRYEGDLTIAELLAHGDLGLGTLDGLDGELIVAGGAAYVARVNGSVVAVDGTVRTPFAVVTPFTPGPPPPMCGLDNAALLAEMDQQCRTTVAAVRVCGYFTRLRVRSVPQQEPPYPPLDRVVHDQVEWEIGPVDAVLVGFRSRPWPRAWRYRGGTCTPWPTTAHRAATCSSPTSPTAPSR